MKRSSFAASGLSKILYSTGLLPHGRTGAETDSGLCSGRSMEVGHA